MIARSPQAAKAKTVLLAPELPAPIVGGIMADEHPHFRTRTSMPTPAARRWPRWLPIVGWSVLSVLGAILLLFLATVTFGAVHGREFCPQTFERRSYSYYELPLVHIQMTGERHDDLTGDTEKHVTSNKYITPVVGKRDW